MALTRDAFAYAFFRYPGGGARPGAVRQTVIRTGVTPSLPRTSQNQKKVIPEPVEAS